MRLPCLRPAEPFCECEEARLRLRLRSKWTFFNDFDQATQLSFRELILVVQETNNGSNITICWIGSMRKANRLDQLRRDMISQCVTIGEGAGNALEHRKLTPDPFPKLDTELLVVLAVEVNAIAQDSAQSLLAT